MLRRQKLYNTVKHLILSHYNVSENEQLEDKKIAFIHFKLRCTCGFTCSTAEGGSLSLCDRLAQLGQASHQ